MKKYSLIIEIYGTFFQFPHNSFVFYTNSLEQSHRIHPRIIQQKKSTQLADLGGLLLYQTFKQSPNRLYLSGGFASRTSTQHDATGFEVSVP
jgi:hypothetical protein